MNDSQQHQNIRYGQGAPNGMPPMPQYPGAVPEAVNQFGDFGPQGSQLDEAQQFAVAPPTEVMQQQPAGEQPVIPAGAVPGQFLPGGGRVGKDLTTGKLYVIPESKPAVPSSAAVHEAEPTTRIEHPSRRRDRAMGSLAVPGQVEAPAVTTGGPRSLDDIVRGVEQSQQDVERAHLVARQQAAQRLIDQHQQNKQQ